MRIVVSVQLEQDQPETYPDTSPTLPNAIMRSFVNDPYRNTVPQQCDCSSQSRRTTANLISVSFSYTAKAGSFTTRTGKNEAVIRVLRKLGQTELHAAINLLAVNLQQFE